MKADSSFYNTAACQGYLFSTKMNPYWPPRIFASLSFCLGKKFIARTVLLRPAGGLLTGDMYQYKQNMTRVSLSLVSLQKSNLFSCKVSVSCCHFPSPLEEDRKMAGGLGKQLKGTWKQPETVSGSSRKCFPCLVKVLIHSYKTTATMLKSLSCPRWTDKFISVE